MWIDAAIELHCFQCADLMKTVFPRMAEPTHGGKNPIRGEALLLCPERMCKQSLIE